MRKKRRNQFAIILVILGVGVYAVLLNQVDQIGIIGGNWTSITNSILSYLPQLVGISLGFVLLVKDKGNYSTTPIRLMLLTSIIGVVFASLFFEMFNDGIWIDEIVTATYTITDFQFTVILLFFLVGILLGLMKKR
jgi:hypothetical protein